ncbi:hypothetical protein KKF81_02385 [Candidatus Micrarchaeota archaeon]|nr:hypothetical protein [Candidatus Micrarchaeota archaeon]MBU1165768.1 hypothetical protein [Candidatus Micrarchaeota archaeon]MBU1886259.1 hypothetical protein [Candidatus Micrarchaeota archaeon]
MVQRWRPSPTYGTNNEHASGRGTNEKKQIVIPLTDKSDPRHVLPRESNPELLEIARTKIEQDAQYTLKQAAEISNIPVGRWKKWVRPSEGRTPRIDGCVVSKKTYITGRDILGVIEELAKLPKETIPLQEVAKLVGRTPEGFRVGSISWFENERFIEYKKSDGKTIFIPVYRGLDRLSLFMSRRDYEMIKRDVEAKKECFEWNVAQDYMASKGVNLVSAGLKSDLDAKIERHDDGSAYLKYVSPDGRIAEVPVVSLTSKRGIASSYQIARKELDKLIGVVLEDQKEFIPYQDMLDELGLRRTQTAILTTNGREFSVDGDKRWIKLYCPIEYWINFMRRSDMELFSKWRSFHGLEGREYTLVRKAVCGVFTAKVRKEKYAQFETGLKHTDDGFEYAMGENLGLRIREVDSCYYVRKGYGQIIRFHLNLMHEDPRVLTRTLNMLKVSLRKNKNDMITVFMLWVARGVYISFDYDTMIREQKRFKKFDSLFCSLIARTQLNLYPITEFDKWAANTDLRYYR